MKTILLLINLLSPQPDTTILNYGDLTYMVQDSIIAEKYNLQSNLSDGYYIIMDNYGGPTKFKRREVLIRKSKINMDIRYYEISYLKEVNSSDSSADYYPFQSQPPIKIRYEFTEDGIEKYLEYYKSENLKTIEIINTNLKVQPLISERWHFENGALKMILEKSTNSNLYNIKYYYETGELLASGQFDEYNRPSGKWKYYFKNGRVQKEGTVCTECVQKIWRPWIEVSVIQNKGL